MKSIAKVMVLATALACFGISASSSSARTMEASSEIWRPALGVTWQWQLGGGKLDASFGVDVYDIDGFDNSKAIVDRLHGKGSRAVCYVSVGSWENWRPDKGQFPNSVLGNKYYGWPGEKWLDIRRIDLLGPIMQSRMDMCAAKGFDAIEPDNMDGYANKTGFPLTYADQLRYNKWLADEAHQRGLSIAMKNNEAQVKDLLPYYDFAITEDCFDGRWCGKMSPFVEQGKAVLAAEYTDTGMTKRRFCPKAGTLNFDAILKKRNLGPWRRAC